MKTKRIMAFTFALIFLISGLAFAAENPELLLTEEELAEYNGKDGKPAYVAVDGIVYDFTNSKAWEEGAHNGFEAGRDLTEEINDISPHGTKVLEKMPVVGRLEGKEATSSDLVLTEEELAEYNGKDGKPAYVAIDGIIYDFTDSPSWQDGEHNGLSAGKDLTKELAGAPHGAGVAGKYPVVGNLKGYEANTDKAKAASNLYEVFGVLSAFILLLMILPFLLTRLNKAFIKTKSPKFFNVVKSLRKIHKPLGLIFGIVAIVHGYMALGGFKLHSGTLVFFSIVVTVILGGVFNKTRNKNLLKVHRLLALITVVLLFIHLLFPWII